MSTNDLKSILAKAATDAGFREQILANPDAAGFRLPDGTVFAEDAESAPPGAIILPPLDEAGELSDSELQDVAGGSYESGGTLDLRKPSCGPSNCNP